VKLERLIAEQLALHATPHGRASQGQNVARSLTVHALGYP